MKLQQHPNPWMCVPLSFAMALDVPVADLLVALGHDGSKILYPRLPEPACRQGFHIQELIQVALKQGLAVTPVELFPVSAVYEYTYTIMYPNNWDMFATTIAESCGVIDGVSRLGHMVAYDHGRVFDSKGYDYNYSRLACEDHQFYTRCAWRIDPIGARL